MSSTLSDIFCDEGNLLPTLTVSFVIASLETKFKVKVSLPDVTNTFVIEPTYKYLLGLSEKSRPLLVLVLPAIFITTLSPPLKGNPLYNDYILPSSPLTVLPVLTTTALAVIIGE